MGTKKGKHKHELLCFRFFLFLCVGFFCQNVQKNLLAQVPSLLKIIEATDGSISSTCFQTSIYTGTPHVICNGSGAVKFIQPSRSVFTRCTFWFNIICWESCIICPDPIKFSGGFCAPSSRFTTPTAIILNWHPPIPVQSRVSILYLHVHACFFVR